jgi:hypothetical protein
MFTLMKRLVRLGARLCACAPGSLPDTPRRELFANDTLIGVLAHPYARCVLRGRRFRYAAAGMGLHRIEFGFVVHSPCVQDSRVYELHTFTRPPL